MIQSLVLATIVVAALALVGLAIYLVLERRAQAAQITTLLALSQSGKRRWAPGPNANFHKLDAPTDAAIQLGGGDVTQQLMQMVLLQQLGRLTSGQQYPMLPPPQPAHYEAVEDDDLWG